MLKDWLKLVKRPLQTQYAGRELRAYRDVVLADVTRDGQALKTTSLKLQAEGEIVLTAVTQYGQALQYASRKLVS